MIELDNNDDALNVLTNIIGTLFEELDFPDYYYIDLKSEQDVSIQVTNEVFQEYNGERLRKINKDISRKIITIIGLFEYLEEQKLAIFVGELDIKTLGKFCNNADYIPCNFLDDKIKPVIYKFSRKEIFISETLRTLAANNFKTDEEIGYDRELASLTDQLKLTRYALVIAFISLIASIIIPLFSKTEIDSKSIDSIEKLVSKAIYPIAQQLKSPPEKFYTITEPKNDFCWTETNLTQKFTESLNNQLATLNLKSIETIDKINLFIAQSQPKKAIKPNKSKSITCTEIGTKH